MARPDADIQVWLVDDCDYVAARSAEEAVQYEIRNCHSLADGTPAPGADHCEVTDGPFDLTTKMHTGEGPGDPDSEEITFAEAIHRHRRDGGEFPCLLASTEY